MNRYVFLILLPFALAACGGNEPSQGDKPEATAAAAGDYERGPHRGRMLRDGDFALEVTVYETNTPPQFRLYAYRNDKPLAPGEVKATMQLKRLDGEINNFSFVPENDYLMGNGEVVEPHSFDVKADAVVGGKNYTWAYASYEGRTTIDPKAAADAGVVVESAEPGVIRDTVALMGNVAVDTGRFAAVKGRFPGVVRSVAVEMGQRVSAGQTLATVEGNDSMRTYSVTAPFSGVVLARNTAVGDVAADNTLFEIADLSVVLVDLRALGSDAERLSPGQAVTIRSATGGLEATGKLQGLLPLASASQTVVARVALANSEGKWRPGMAVSAEVVIAETEVPLTVKESGLQRFRDFTVVFAQVGDSYEVRMLELGRRDGERVEVLNGLKPGTRYVSEQSYLIRADIEKSGASHDH